MAEAIASLLILNLSDDNKRITMFEYVISALTSTEVTLSNAMFRLVLSMILGTIVGYERKRKGQVAGVRTFALISMGACMAMLLSIYVPQEYLGLKNGDPGRIAAQVVTGVGFLGGGAMIQQKGSIRGLTTAAGIWMVATIGMAVGVGMYSASIFATILIILTLVAFEIIEHRRNLGQISRVINLHVNGIIDDVEAYSQCFAAEGIHLSNFYMQCQYEQNQTEISFIVLVARNTDFPRLFKKLREVRPTLSIALTSEVEV